MAVQLPLFGAHEAEDIQLAQVFTSPDKMLLAAPALFATTAHPKLSERYTFTNTYDILLHIHNRGWRVASVMGGRKPFSKFMVRCRHKDYSYADNAPELIIIDSHDGTSRWRMCLGVIRFVCMNGLISGDISFARSYMHLAPDLLAQIILDIQDIDPHVQELERRVTRLKEYNTTLGERMALAQEVVKARFGEDRSGSFIADMRRRMLEPRRREDTATDMYTVMNVIQENALRGGAHYQVNNTVRRMNEITAVDRNIAINNRVWQVANDLMKKAA